MTDRIKLACSHEQFHAIYESLEHTRKNPEVVKVPKEALTALLRDHGKLIGLHRHELDGIL